MSNLLILLFYSNVNFWVIFKWILVSSSETSALIVFFQLRIAVPQSHSTVLKAAISNYRKVYTCVYLYATNFSFHALAASHMVPWPWIVIYDCRQLMRAYFWNFLSLQFLSIFRYQTAGLGSSAVGFSAVDQAVAPADRPTQWSLSNGAHPSVFLLFSSSQTRR
jgi:hypothetical protein